MASQSPRSGRAEHLIEKLSDVFAGLGGEAGGAPSGSPCARLASTSRRSTPASSRSSRGHPYLRLPLPTFSVALESRLLENLSEGELASLRKEAESELAEPDRWGTTFTLLQSWGRLAS